MGINTKSDIRTEIVETLRILVGEGLFEKAYGHISVRDPESDNIFMTGHIHGLAMTLDELQEEHVLMVDLKGTVLEGDLEPPGEFPIHTEILQARPEVGAVIHCHPKAPVVLSIVGQKVLPVSFRGTIFSPEVPLFEDPTQIDDREKGKALARSLGKSRAVVLRAHGVACVGSDLAEAAVTTLDLNDVAELQIRAGTIGIPSVVSDEYTNQGVIAGLEDEFFSSAWNFYRAKYGFR